jgi:hypothetical protein
MSWVLVKTSARRWSFATAVCACATVALVNACNAGGQTEPSIESSGYKVRVGAGVHPHAPTHKARGASTNTPSKMDEPSEGALAAARPNIVAMSTALMKRDFSALESLIHPRARFSVTDYDLRYGGDINVAGVELAIRTLRAHPAVRKHLVKALTGECSHTKPTVAGRPSGTIECTHGHSGLVPLAQLTKHNGRWALSFFEIMLAHSDEDVPADLSH